MAYIQKRKRNGRTTWRARYRDPVGSIHSKSFDRRVDADRWLHSIETTKTRGEWVDPRLGKTLFCDYVDGWLATKADVAKSTKLNIDGRISKHVRRSLVTCQ